MHIGLIGGIGPAATVVYYQRLCAAVAARGARLELTIVQGDIQTLIRNVAADRRAEQAEIFAALIDRLQAAGADCAAITSMDAHFCFEETRARSALPLVSAVASLDDFCVTQGIGSVGLLGPRIVMQTRLFGQLQRTRVVVVPEEIDEVDALYQNLAVRGTCDPETRARLMNAGAAQVAAGAEAVVLTGVDLNLAFDHQRPGYLVIDAVDVHVALLADLAAGRRDLGGISLNP